MTGHGALAHVSDGRARPVRTDSSCRRRGGPRRRSARLRGVATETSVVTTTLPTDGTDLKAATGTDGAFFALVRRAAMRTANTLYLWCLLVRLGARQ